MSLLTGPEADGVTKSFMIADSIFSSEPDYVPPVQVSEVLIFV